MELRALDMLPPFMSLYQAYGIEAPAVYAAAAADPDLLSSDEQWPTIHMPAMEGSAPR
jgi:hypothetical protein